MDTTCESKWIKNLSYDVDDESCSEEIKLQSSADRTIYSLHECMAVGGMSIHRR